MQTYRKTEPMKKILYLAFFVITLLSCSEDKSVTAELQEFNVTNTSNENLIILKTIINSDIQNIYIYFDNDLSEVAFPITMHCDADVSKGATTSLNSQGELTFTNMDQALEFIVEAENGNAKTWQVFLVHKQLQNSEFESWFETKGLNGILFQEIGSSIETSIWATANLGTSTYSVYGSQPISIENNTLIQVKTDSVLQLPITAGTAFTGYFYLNGAILNPGDPKKATLFGTPFIYKPTAFSVKYKYSAGSYYKQANLRDQNNIFGGFDEEGINGIDKCAIYAILENRNGESVVEIARAELFSSNTNDKLIETTIPFEYTTQIEPTHITVVFSSSKDGDLWRGAVGSTLIIDDLKFIYD
jgi:hypothetical protein